MSDLAVALICIAISLYVVIDVSCCSRLGSHQCLAHKLFGFPKDSTRP